MQRSPRPPHITFNAAATTGPGPVPDPHFTATSREGRSRSIANTVPVSAQSAAAKHRISMSRSPVRSPPPAPNPPSTAQRLRQPFGSVSSSSSSSTSTAHYRRTSMAGLTVDSGDLSSSIGMPYTYQTNAPSSASAGSLSPHASTAFTNHNHTGGSHGGPPARPPVLNSTVPVSSMSSPRSSLDSGTTYTSHSAQLRRHSESINRRPSTAEVFDLMEREQDAIVLKLMKEIQQLKEDNRALLQTINVLTNPSTPGSTMSHSHARMMSLGGGRSRRPSSNVSPEEVLDFSKATLQSRSRASTIVQSPTSQTPRSLFIATTDADHHGSSEHLGIGPLDGAMSISPASCAVEDD